MEKVKTQIRQSSFPTPTGPGKPFFGRATVHPGVPLIQPKLTVNTPGDGESAVSPGFESSLRSARSSGRSLPRDTRHFMESRFGTDFSNVNIHTDSKAVQLSRDVNAQAFTHGNDIYFNEGKFAPETAGGKRLLAHELTHVVQQSPTTTETARRQMIQRTTIGEILDSFFVPWSSEHLWLMNESDHYTGVVRRWQPVINAVNGAKANLEANCETWAADHRTDTSWTPGKTDPPVTDPNAYDDWVSSPPGTDPETCKNAFIIYMGSRVPGPPIQTFALYTCSIGSFGIYVTVDNIDCQSKTADMKIWMYNAMDQRSFGKFASNPVFSLSGMERQYMWWNWTESHSWGASTSSGSGSAGSGGGW